MDEGKIVRHNIDMKTYLSAVALLFSLAASAEVSDLANCSQKYQSNEVSEERHFKVSRDGDRLFSKYRESKVDEYETSDDVTIKVFEDAALEDFFKEESYRPIIEAFDSPRSKIKKVYFFGVEQQNLPEEDLGSQTNKYLFELWFGENEFSKTKVVLVRDSVTSCDKQKTLWPFLSRKF